jgi:hypothetical protein
MRLDPDSDGVVLGTVNLGKLSDDVKDTVSLAWPWVRRTVPQTLARENRI